MDKKTPYHYMNQVKNLSGIGEMRKLIKAFPLIYLIFVTLWLRLINLGYSDYQGDEIKALYRPEAGQGISEFLFSQRKGPIQFFVTYIIKIFNPNYDNEFFVRLPFAVAGILAVYFFISSLNSILEKKLLYTRRSLWQLTVCLLLLPG